ncbi:replication protein A 70 kDa DNA-binding subunit C-like [Helianthus annuus]|uniref:replication protein A 70 kDa DNA-binding subunit C-like n=1 Tax=Helianthus annuus TaxID=4232 RepID=UPI000B8F6234|nr:replication protein A 70 kDa DNA-binding subunit C-like [Helianthus annuus]
MEVAKVNMLNDLNTFSNNYSIRVKIVSISKKMMNNNKNEICRLDMIFMDEMGTMIQASCLHKMLGKFKEFLQLDECLLITKPSLATNKSSAKYTKRNDKISLYFYTSVEKCFDWSGPKYRFNFVNLKDVVKNKFEVNTVIDWIGYVDVCFNLEDTSKKDGSKGKRLNLRLKDIEGQKCPVTLWDGFAIDMFAYMNDKKREKYVVILCHFGMVNLYKGKRGVANGFELSRPFIDTDIEEISSFRKRYVEKISASSSSNDHVGLIVISSVEDEFLNNPDFMLIDKEGFGCWDNYSYMHDKLWYYNGCNHCKSGVEERFVTKENPNGLSDVYHEKSLVCTNDKCEGVDIYSIPRFKIPIMVQDSSGTVSLTLFDFEAYKILQKTAKELVSIQDQVVNSGEIPNPYPEIFDTLMGKRYAFIISVKNYNIEHQVENYGISMATNDDEILSALCAKFNLNQDEMSYCGDNVTPASQALVGTENPSSDETKRNIREVFDVDDALGCSSTKRRISDELSQDEDAGVSTLLIPKIEKYIWCANGIQPIERVDVDVTTILTTRPCHWDLHCRNVQPLVVIDAHADAMPPKANVELLAVVPAVVIDDPVIAITVAIGKNDMQCTPAEVLAVLSDLERVLKALFMFPTMFL